ncbi:MAG: hypothetical protein IBX56_13170 [Methylomicrobium sp.]|nr:hypothetical protein [Methylomicrobium sp.]
MPTNADSWPSVDVVIPSYDEPADLVKITLAAAKNIDYPKHKLQIYLLDDGATEQKLTAEEPLARHAAISEHELKLLGSIGIAVPVEVYDGGRHRETVPHAEPFAAHLLFAEGALLRNGPGQTPVDWDVVGADGEIDAERYYRLYLHRLLPLLWHANDFYAGARATDNGKKPQQRAR